MSTQITVHLPDDLLAFVDAQVSDGQASGRAEMVARALDRERRRQVAAEDARIYAATGDDADLAAFTRLVARAASADYTAFVLDQQQWQTWERLNEPPARDLPGLREFLSRPPVFVDEQDDD